MPTVSVGNIRNKPLPMPRRKAREDIAKLCRMGTVNLACEMGPRYYKRYFREATGWAFFEKSKVMIGLPLAYSEVRGVTRNKITGGLPGINPRREANRVTVLGQHFGDTDFYSTHFPNGAWNFKHKPFKRWRKKAWLRAERNLRHLIEESLAAGRNVVVGGDFNTGPDRQHVHLHENQVLAVRAGLMHLYAIPTQGHTAKIMGRRVERDVHTDHPFLRAFIHFTREETR